MSALILAAIATALGVGYVVTRKDDEGGADTPPIPTPDVPHTLTGTVGPVVYSLERAGDDYRWSIAGGESGAEDSVKAAVRAMFERALALPVVRPEDVVTGAAGGYVFTVTAEERWTWTAVDLVGAVAGSDTAMSRGLAILGALKWLRDHGAVDWLAAPSSLAEPGAVGAPTTEPDQPDETGASDVAPAVVRTVLVQEGPFPGLAVREDGTVSVVDRDAWLAYARPRIRDLLAAGAPDSEAEIAEAVFGEVPGANITFGGHTRAQTWAKVRDAVVAIYGNDPYVPASDEWLADLIVGRWQKYPGVATSYKGNVIVARDVPGGWRWEYWPQRRGLDGAGKSGFARTVTAAVGIAKKTINASLPKPATVQIPKPDCQTKPLKRSGTVNLPARSWIGTSTKEIDVLQLAPGAGCTRFRVVVAVCLRTRSGATYGLMDLATHGWPPKAKPGSKNPWKLEPTYPPGFEGFEGFAIYPPADTASFALPGAWKSTLRTTVALEPAGGNVSGWNSTASAPIAVGGLDACPNVEPRWIAQDVDIEGTDGITRPWKRPKVEIVAVGGQIKIRLIYPGLPVFALKGRRGMAAGSSGGGLRLEWRAWAIAEA